MFPLLSDLWRRINPWHYGMPTHGHRFFYTLGGIVFAGFLIMVATGLLLTQVYNPAPEEAYNSLQILQTRGWTRFVRAVHYWTAQGILIALLLHLARVFITGAYKYPRQITWWCGIALFATMLMGSYFSGTVLKWDEGGFDALAHYREALQSLGPIGAALTDTLPGSPPLNFKVYISHTAVFPLLLTTLILLHFYLVHILNLSPTMKDAWADQPDIPPSSMTGTLGEHARSIMIFSVLYYGWIGLLAFFVPAPLGAPPTHEHSPLKPPWPFLWMYGFENRWGVGAVIYASAVLFLILAAIPILDRKQDRRLKARKPILALGAGLAVALVGLTLYGYITPAQTHTHHSSEKPHERDKPHTHDATFPPTSQTSPTDSPPTASPMKQRDAIPHDHEKGESHTHSPETEHH